MTVWDKEVRKNDNKKRGRGTEIFEQFNEMKNIRCDEFLVLAEERKLKNLHSPLETAEEEEEEEADRIRFCMRAEEADYIYTILRVDGGVYRIEFGNF